MSAHAPPNAREPEVWNPLDHGLKGLPLMVPAHEYNRLRSFVEDCTGFAGHMVNGNRLAATATELLSPNVEAQPPSRRSDKAQPMSAEDDGGLSVGCSDLLGWLAGKVTQCKKDIAARAEMEERLREGSGSDWWMAAARTGTPPMSRKQRLEAADVQTKCMARLRTDLSMLQTAISLLPPNS